MATCERWRRNQDTALKMLSHSHTVALYLASLDWQERLIHSTTSTCVDWCVIGFDVVHVLPSVDVLIDEGPPGARREFQKLIATRVTRVGCANT